MHQMHRSRSATAVHFARRSPVHARQLTLVAVRESPNVRALFDGIRVSWRDSAATPMPSSTGRDRDGAFDDGSDRDELLWDTAASRGCWAAGDSRLTIWDTTARTQPLRAASPTSGDTRSGLRSGRRQAVDWNLLRLQVGGASAGTTSARGPSPAIPATRSPTPASGHGSV